MNTMNYIQASQNGLNQFQSFCNELLYPEDLFALEAINLKGIPAKVKNVIETIGRLIKTLLEKIKSIFSRSKTFQMPYDVYKEGIDLDNFIVKETQKAMRGETPDMDSVFKRYNTLRNSSQRIGNGGKPVTLAESTITQRARSIQDTYNTMVKAINLMNGKPLPPSYGAKMDNYLYAAKLLQHRIMIYTYFMSFFNEKVTVEQMLILQ